MSTIDVVQAFADKINERDVDGLCALMTEDHLFTDACDGTGQGREHMREGWKDYYAMIPDYWIRVDHIYCEGNTAGAFGRAGGTYATGGTLKPENKWDIPAAWYAVIRDDKVAEWRVYADNEPLRNIIIRETGQS